MPRPKSEPYPQSSLNQNDICVTLATANEGNFLNAYTIRNGKALPCQRSTRMCWVEAKLGTKFSIHVGYDGICPSYPGIGALAITVFFDGVRVSDMFITPESLTARVEQKLAKRAEALRNQRGGKKLSEAKLDELEASVVDGEEIPGATEIVGCPSNKGVIRPFCFAPRKVVDNDIHWGNLDSLGQIAVEVRWAKVTTGLPGSMKALYGDIWKLDEWIGRRFVGHKHKFVATTGLEAIDLGVNEEREAEGGYRFKSEPLDDKVYRFIFHYADEGTLRDEGFLVPDRMAGKAVRTKALSISRRSP